ncbi:hydrogen gas-evolving membrane-bound hydrogenase subunit E [Saccharopolyspora spinosporotrichia]
MLTVAYTARLLWGAFSTKPGVAPTEVKPVGPGLLLPTAVPAVVGVVLGVVYGVPDYLAATYASQLGNTTYHLALWHGVNVVLVCTALALVGGALLHVVRFRLAAFRRDLPRPLDAQRGYERVMGLLERVAVGVTGRLQVGSLPTYVGIILLTVLAVPGTALVLNSSVPEDLRFFDNLLQVPLAIVVVVAAVAALRSHRRLTAVLMVGVVGYGIGGLFIVDGGPDLALAQFLVETLTLVAFVFVLRRLPAHFSTGETTLRLPKMLIAAAAGTFIAFAALIFSSARQVPPISHSYLAQAEEGAGATNVVNSIIVDFRAFDTVGEISVLAVAATGVASLILASRFERRKRSTRATAVVRQPKQKEEVRD